MLGETRVAVESYVGAVRWNILDVREGKMGTFVAVITSRLPGLQTLAARENVYAKPNECKVQQPDLTPD